MKAFILAAGLGTRLRPWTLTHPKALVPVAGVPMLERVIRRLESEGFDDITINVHHFAGQIIDYLHELDLGVKVTVSDESGLLLDTGGGILHAGEILTRDSEPFLVHNVDILSDAPLAEMMKIHKMRGWDVTLLTSGRDSSRKLIFDDSGVLFGWRNLVTGEYKPSGFEPDGGMAEHAFSGIYVMSATVVDALREYSDRIGRPDFPIMDFFMQNSATAWTSFDHAVADNVVKIGENFLQKLNLIDIGKPQTLEEADRLLRADQW